MNHFMFSCYGIVETTLEELYNTFKRNDFIPKGIVSTLQCLEEEKRVRITRKKDNRL